MEQLVRIQDIEAMRRREGIDDVKLRQEIHALGVCAPENVSWVVYLMTVRGMATGVRAVCQQGEWEAMERAQPGRHTLIQSGIATEGEAERSARVGAATAAAAAAASTATA